MHIAWTIVAGQYPEKLKPGQSEIWTADVEYENGKPHLINKKLALDSTSLPFKCTLECQNFRPPDEKELDVLGLRLSGNGCLWRESRNGEGDKLFQCAKPV